MHVLYFNIHTTDPPVTTPSSDPPVITPSSAVLFPGSEVIFTCNTTANAVLWEIDGHIHLGNSLPIGTYLVNPTTLLVHMSTNASSYACAVPIGSNANLSNTATLFLAG